jgi:hypothetical protein
VKSSDSTDGSWIIMRAIVGGRCCHCDRWYVTGQVIVTDACCAYCSAECFFQASEGEVRPRAQIETDS